MDPNRVVAFRIDAPAPDDRWLFEPTASVVLARLAVAPAQDEPIAPELAQLLDRRDAASRFAMSVTDKEQHVEARGTLLFAHAPSAPGIVLTAPTTLHVRYGIMDSAWTPPQHTDGACFVIKTVAPDGQATPLYEHCLMPLEQEADRGEHEATVHVQTSTPVRLVLETDCHQNCSWDWSYWKDIELDPPPGAPTPADSATAMPRAEVVTRLAQSWTGKDQHVEARGTLLFAHALAAPSIELPSLHALRVSYGIFSDAWREGRVTDGVCFQIIAEPAHGAPRRIHERCLTPAERIDERNEQQFATTVDIPGPVKLVLETQCRKNCENDWSYWKDIDIVP